MGIFPLFQKIKVKMINMLQDYFFGKSSLKTIFLGVCLAIYFVLGCYKYCSTITRMYFSSDKL
jgi:hypothetical protein